MSSQGVIIWLREPFEAHVVQELNAQSSKFTVVRRCADITEMEAAVHAGLGTIIIADADAPGINVESIDRFHARGGFVLLVFADPISAPSLGEDARCGPSDASEVIDALTVGLRERILGTEFPAHKPPPPPAPENGTAGKTIVVWGTSGAPGRSTISHNLAHQLARYGLDVTLVDADTRAPSLAQMLGTDLEGSGLATASLLRQRGGMDTCALKELRHEIDDHLYFLSGLTGSDRWRQLSPESVCEVIRRLADSGHVVVDLCDGLSDGDPSQLTFVPSREDINLDVIRMADYLLIVSRADAIGLTRLGQVVNECVELDIAIDLIVVNRVRQSAAGQHPEQTVQSVLQTICRHVPRVLIDDCPDVDRAILHGTSVVSVAPKSDYIATINQILARLNLADIDSSREDMSWKKTLRFTRRSVGKRRARHRKHEVGTRR
ncbi:MAG: P-loop NTPase [Actinomycetaceae bacterium]|nr:P-loop NTPase [Actinomycetaceae bacterium]